MRAKDAGAGCRVQFDSCGLDRVFSILIMQSPNTHSLRIIVQHMREPQRSVYRLVAYGGEGGDYMSRSVGFESPDHWD